MDTTGLALDYWSGDGRSLAIRTEAGDAILQIEVLNYDTENWPDAACGLVGRNMTETEWEQYGPRTLERRAPCPEYPLP